VIESLAELLLDGSAGPLNAQQADLARRIRTSTRQVITLSQNLLDAERADAGRLVLQRRLDSIATVVGDALAVARNASDIKGVALHAELEPGLPPLSIDAVQIERVFANLLGNAIKFTPAGGSVRLIVRRHGGDVVVAVADDGPGIPPEELPRLAERHFRGARSRGVDGSGLGLFIVRAVIEAHGGSVRIASGLGRGTTVTVTLPMAVPEAAADLPAAKPAPPMIAARPASVG
jgi:signal transduction histidine kinase